jgi:hypothetical protein
VQYSDSEARDLVEEFIGVGKIAAPDGRVRRAARPKPAAAARR